MSQRNISIACSSYCVVTGIHFSLGRTLSIFEKRTLSPEETLHVGLVMIVVSLIYLGLVAFRFDWLRRHIPLRWGTEHWGFPASRLGASTGGFAGLFFGTMAIDSYFKLFPRAAWAIALFGLLGFVLIAAIHDYRRNKRSAAQLIKQTSRPTFRFRRGI